MRPLENRRWFIALTFAVSALIAEGVFKLGGIDFSMRSGLAFLFTTMGLGMGVNKLLALLFIKVNPALGNV